MRRGIRLGLVRCNICGSASRRRPRLPELRRSRWTWGCRGTEGPERGIPVRPLRGFREEGPGGDRRPDRAPIPRYL